MGKSENLRGIVTMCLSMMAFTVNDTFMKSVTETLPLFQTIFLRGVLASLGLAVIAAATGAFGHRISRADARLVGIRSAADVLATVFFLMALVHMPLANISALMQAIPLAVTLGAAVVFGDRVGWRRMTAILAGLIGVLIIIRPGAEGFDRWALLAVLSVLCVVVRDLAVRPMQGQLPAVVVALGAAVAVALMGLAGSAIEGWVPVTLGQGAQVMGAGGFLIIGYLTSVLAMRYGDIGIVAPFRYTSLLWALVLGLAVFGDWPDGWTLLGAAVVVAAGIFTLLRERALRRAASKSDPRGR